MAERHEKAPPQRFRCQPVHVVTTSVSGALQKWCSSTTDRGKKLERTSNQNKAGVAIVMLLAYVAIDRSTVHPPGWSWMVATMDRELSRDTAHYNPVAL